MFFDPRAAKLLLPGAHILIDGCPGLRLVARAARKTWIYRYKLDGKIKQTVIGLWPSVGAADAASRWQALRDGRAEGADPQDAKKVEPKVEGYTVKALVEDYIAGHLETSRKPEGALAAKKALTKLLIDDPEFSASQASALTRGVAFQAIEARKATPTAAAKLRSMLGGAWEYALDSGKLAEVPNWWREIHRGKLKSKGKIVGGVHVGRSRRVLSDVEVATLLAWLPNMHVLGRDALQMYLWTGARGSEILGMRPEHVARGQGGEWWWTVPKALTKNAAKEFATDHRVPLVGRALQIVDRRLSGVGASGLLFEDARGGQYTQHDFSTYIYNLQPYSNKVRDRAGEGLILPVSEWTPHNLRRTTRTMLSAIGCSKDIAEAILGHLPDVIEATYNAYSYDKERRQWLTKLDAHLESIASSVGLPALP